MDRERDAWSRNAALAFLVQRIDYERALAVPYSERTYKLDRMRELLARLGHPQRRMPIVHVAGTKGKGSTAAMLAAVLTESGRRTGLFSSPHLDRIEERFVIDGQLCPSETFADLVQRLAPVVAEMDAVAGVAGPYDIGPTYFELTTALALEYFAEQRADAAVLEVGMGGRFDSTNVCLPVVSVITSISFDHTKQLGNTLAAIAGEKAGIIKPGVSVVSGVLDDEPREVIANVASERGCRLIQMGRDFDFHYTPPRQINQLQTLGSFDFRSTLEPIRAVDRISLGLLGRHQGANAAVVLATVSELRRQGWSIDEPAIRRGLMGVTWPARVEVVSSNPTVVIDAAHNVASIDALLATLDESFSNRRRMLLFATTREKDVRGMLRSLLPKFDRVVFTRYQNNPRGIPPSELLAESIALLGADAASQRCIIADTPIEAWTQLRSMADRETLICITGSFFIASEIRALALA